MKWGHRLSEKTGALIDRASNPHDKILNCMTANELVAKVKNLPPVPNAALRLISLLDKPETGNDDVVQSIRCDNVLTAKLLRACNSPYFGFPDPVASVDQAVLVLGHQQILHIVLTLAFGSAMTVPLPGYAAESNELWEHSLTTAVAAEVVVNSAADLNMEAPVAFTAGLLHDIGKLVMGQMLDSSKQSDIRDCMAANGISRSEAERAIIGTDHADVGAHLLQIWNLPENVVEAVANHHRPVFEPRPRLSVVTHIANYAAHRAGALPGVDVPGANLDPQVIEQIAVSADEIERIVADVRESSESVDRFMALA
jgi:putative nucleotidyltransferase with HDIG domain